MQLYAGPTLALALLAAGCANDLTGPDSEGRGPRTGSLAFSTISSRGWSSIDVTVDGIYVGTIRNYFTTEVPASCTEVPDVRIVATVLGGAHSYSAQTNTGTSWSGTVSVPANGCEEIRLNCPDGDCEP